MFRGFGLTFSCVWTALRESWAVRTEKKIYKLVDSNFMGKPEPAIDEAWHELLGGLLAVFPKGF